MWADADEVVRVHKDGSTTPYITVIRAVPQKTEHVLSDRTRHEVLSKMDPPFCDIVRLAADSDGFYRAYSADGVYITTVPRSVALFLLK